MGSRKKAAGRSIPYVSLFTGAMGLDLGLEQVGFDPVVCNEIDSACVETIRTNRPGIPLLTESIENLSREDFEEAAASDLHDLSLLAGGPPCQAFSVFGRRKGLKDHRGRLVFEFVRLVDELQPKIFLMENVRGLHSMPITPGAENGTLLKHLIQCFEKVGYRLDCFVVNAVNYGAPQLRERVICVGNRFNLEADFPEPQFSNRPQDGLPPFSTLGDAISGDFVDPDPSIMNFSERKLRYLSMVPAGGNWRSLPEDVQKEAMGKQYYLKGGRSSTWRKLSFDFPCPTIQTMPNHAATSMCHPTELRALTVGECAAVMEFPREWRFVGTPTEKMRQIGNAVPVRLGKVAGEVARNLLGQIDTCSPAKKGAMSPSRVRQLRPHVRTRSWWRDGKALAGSHSYVQPESRAVAQSS
ncbi:MAG TPA: DNA cytosine methyltransferase [Solirubrobacterales bacterium]|nr:DNA cytosine methyltransferase [Solirubrobacterales bacterium]